MWKIVRGVSVGLWLCYLAKEDQKTKTVPVSVLAVGSILPLFYGSMLFLKNPQSRIAGLITGMIFLFISKVTEEGIAYVDSYLILVLGFYLGFWKLVGILAFMWILILPVAMIRFLKSQYSRKATIPMIPYLTVSYLVTLLSQGKGG